MPDNHFHINPLSVPLPGRSIVCSVLQWIDVDKCLNRVTDPTRWTGERTTQVIYKDMGAGNVSLYFCLAIEHKR